MDFLTQDLNVAERPADNLSDEISSREELVEFLTEDGDLTDISGVGKQTSQKVWEWYKQEYPEKNQQRRQESDSYCTEYTKDVDIEPQDSGKPVWAWVCPRCDAENPMNAYPSDCANRPYACINCQWVPLLDGEAMEPLIEELG